MASVRWLVALLLGWPATAAAQPGIPDDFRDSLVLRLAAIRTPCPDPPPAAWSLVDTTLGRPPRCSLVASAAQLLREHLRARPRRDGVADPSRALCVRLVVLANTGSTGLPGDWLVVFDLAPTVSAEVVIDRRSAAPSVMSIGEGPPRWGAPCLTRSGSR
jgi:hypothetical protein